MGNRWSGALRCTALHFLPKPVAAAWAQQRLESWNCVNGEDMFGLWRVPFRWEGSGWAISVVTVVIVHCTLWFSQYLNMNALDAQNKFNFELKHQVAMLFWCFQPLYFTSENTKPSLKDGRYEFYFMNILCRQLQTVFLWKIKEIRAWEMEHLVNCLPHKHEDLSSNPCTYVKAGCDGAHL